MTPAAGPYRRGAKLVVGLTGGIGSGKSAAAARFEHHGIVVADTDRASRAVVSPGQPALDAIAARFGSSVLSDGELDRAQLRRIVFEDPDARRWLEHLLHPLIGALVGRLLSEARSPYAILANAIMVETGETQTVDRVLVVDVPESVQLNRTMSRDGNSEAQVRRIISAQASRQARLAAADDVIENSGSISALNARVDELHRRYLSLASP